MKRPAGDNLMEWQNAACPGTPLFRRYRQAPLEPRLTGPTGRQPMRRT